MRQKRAKMYKRAMAVYVQTFNFRTPFQVLVSNDILSTGAAQQLDLIKGLQTCTQDEIKPTLYAKGKEAQKVTNLAKTLERRRCNHRVAIPPDQCLTDVIGPTNKHRYIVATQSTDLLTSLQSIPGVPIIHFNPRGVLVLSPLSIATERTKNALEEGRRLEGNKILDGLDEGDNVVGAGSTGAGGSIALTAPPPGLGLGRRKVKGVNPLSMKKKKVMPPQDGVATTKKGSEAAKRKREVEEEDGEVEHDTRQDQEADTGGATSTVGEDARKKKKKRKRKNKSEVAKAIDELNATNRAGDEAEGDDSD